MSKVLHDFNTHTLTSNSWLLAYPCSHGLILVQLLLDLAYFVYSRLAGSAMVLSRYHFDWRSLGFWMQHI